MFFNFPFLESPRMDKNQWPLGMDLEGRKQNAQGLILY